MKKLIITFYALAATLLVASCGNKKAEQVDSLQVEEQ